MALDQVNIDKYAYDEETGKLVYKEEVKEMSFLDHLEELRWHIIRSLIAVVTLTIIWFLAKDFIFTNIILAPKYADFPSYQLLCSLSKTLFMGDAMCFQPIIFEVTAIEMGELFLTHISVSFFLGIIVAFPYIFWEFWRFLKPGLYKKEQKAVKGIVFICSFLFFLGVLFGYYVISPFAINFLAGYNIQGVIPQVRLASIVNYMIMFTAPAGLIFELPVVVYFLSKIGLLTPDIMRQYRKHSIVIILIVAAVITPPDVMTQFLIAIPLYILYEISIFISARMSKKYEQELGLIEQEDK